MDAARATKKHDRKEKQCLLIMRMNYLISIRPGEVFRVENVNEDTGKRML